MRRPILFEIAQNVAMSSRVVQRLAMRFHRTGLVNDLDRSREVYARLVAECSVAGKDVVEIGPGQNARLLQLARDGGARSTIGVDILDYFAEKRADLSGIDLRIYDGRELPLRSASADVIWAHDVFEHLRHPEITIPDCFRVLRPGGHLLCEVDIRDHYETEESRLADNLRYPRWLWNAMTWYRSAFTNRVRYSQWLDLFRTSGFATTTCEPRSSAILQRIRTSRAHLRAFSEQDVAVTAFFAVLRRPVADAR